MYSLLDAALAYANHGIPVMPLHTPTDRGCSCRRPACDRPGKHPRYHPQLLPTGLHRASVAVADIRNWWTRWPAANIGLRTGVTVDVCDIDGPEGVEALRPLMGELAGDAPMVRTGSGGWHIYVAATGLGNRVRLLPSVDWRGVGGYVVAPPSLHASGNRYRWIHPWHPDAPHCPAALLSLLTTPPPLPPSLTPAAVHHTGRYAAAALQGEVARVASAPAGQRNDTLFRSAAAIGELVAGGLLSPNEAVSALAAAAGTAGLGPAEAERTIRSGLRAGGQHPRRVDVA